jgi:hypothetical protein
MALLARVNHVIHIYQYIALQPVHGQSFPSCDKQVMNIKYDIPKPDHLVLPNFSRGDLGYFHVVICAAIIEQQIYIMSLVKERARARVCVATVTKQMNVRDKQKKRITHGEEKGNGTEVEPENGSQK